MSSKREEAHFKCSGCQRVTLHARDVDAPHHVAWLLLAIAAGGGLVIIFSLSCGGLAIGAVLATWLAVCATSKGAGEWKCLECGRNPRSTEAQSRATITSSSGDL